MYRHKKNLKWKRLDASLTAAFPEVTLRWLRIPRSVIRQTYRHFSNHRQTEECPGDTVHFSWFCSLQRLQCGRVSSMWEFQFNPTINRPIDFAFIFRWAEPDLGSWVRILHWRILTFMWKFSGDFKFYLVGDFGAELFEGFFLSLRMRLVTRATISIDRVAASRWTQCFPSLNWKVFVKHASSPITFRIQSRWG